MQNGNWLPMLGGAFLSLLSACAIPPDDVILTGPSAGGTRATLEHASPVGSESANSSQPSVPVNRPEDLSYCDRASEIFSKLHEGPTHLVKTDDPLDRHCEFSRPPVEGNAPFLPLFLSLHSEQVRLFEETDGEMILEMVESGLGTSVMGFVTLGRRFPAIRLLTGFSPQDRPAFLSMVIGTPDLISLTKGDWDDLLSQLDEKFPASLKLPQYKKVSITLVGSRRSEVIQKFTEAYFSERKLETTLLTKEDGFPLLVLRFGN